jgi:glycosyltransferase involved in cell wall biosynthesis
MPGLFDAKKDWVHHITDLFFKDCIQQGIPAEKQFLLPHFIRLPEQANATAIETIKKLALSKYIVLSVGSLDESVKGMNTLAKALSTIKNKVFPVFIGESTAQTPALEQQLRQNFGDDFLITKMEPHELTAYYNASDLFVSCSKAESFGLVMLEAMAQGTPVLCKNWPGSDWVFDKHAHYIKDNDPAVLGNQIEFLLESNCKKKSTAILKAYVSSRFCEDSLAKDYILMFERMVNPSENVPKS